MTQILTRPATIVIAALAALALIGISLGFFTSAALGQTTGMGNIGGLEADGVSFNTSTDAQLVGPGDHIITGNYLGPGAAAFASRVDVTIGAVVATTNDDTPQVLENGISFGVVMNAGNKSFTLTITVPEEIDVSAEIMTAGTAPGFDPDLDAYWDSFFIGIFANDPNYDAAAREFHFAITEIIFGGLTTPDPATTPDPDPTPTPDPDLTPTPDPDPTPTPDPDPTPTPTGNPPADPPTEPPTGTPPTDPPADPPAVPPADTPEVLPGTGSGGLAGSSNGSTWAIAIGLAVLLGLLSTGMTFASRRGR